ncbi:D-isomer specific 2-hydroxyacid dehydrogenase family protein [Goodfellowiella coeruleoviolacea]|uniref:D-3-phosphoglycerate dehydrogenase n=1 Tax=Goodfellowiella coeruleoviolacea TaxID=334858 RepID=A0AAE3GAY6_9PSEU|nr:D-isomer specific 2-hydroxyacid dehydrogenase family protein [Goodfellowiella coeruleoviolacea]MCP2164911.1 D-3-phosphoglycerate dehydrogenase [Goodfellowiella coeruleoviolacea]
MPLDSKTVRIAVLPDPTGSAARVAQEAGAHPVPLHDANALVWTASSPAEFPTDLPDSVRWVQLPSAGVEKWLANGIVDRQRVWTSATGAYSRPVAEHALTLMLAAARRLPDCVRATTWRKDELRASVGTLRDATVVIVGCGGIGRALIPLVGALGGQVVAVNRSGRPVPGAQRTIAAADAADVWSQGDYLVLAAPATQQTERLVGAEQLRRMRSSAWLVNVARGTLVDTDALVAALDAGEIAGAALDVTDPEPLPDGHPLWTHPRAIITPHVANPETTLRAYFHERLTHNIRRYASGEPLIGVVDLDAGY